MLHPSHPPLPSFIPFEERADAIEVAELDMAIRRSGRPENMLTASQLGNIPLAITIIYPRLLGEEDNRQCADVAYNSFYFGAVVGSFLIGNVGTPTTPPYPTAFDETAGPDTPQKLHDDRNKYLEHRPTLKRWTSRYLPILDPTAAYPQLATTVATLTLKDIEERERQGFIDAEVHLLT